MKMKLPFIITSLALSFTVVGCGNNNIPETIIPTSSLMSIAVTKNPNKTTYLINEEFDSTGLEVTATYRDKTTAVVTEYTLSGFSSETAGVKTITVSYKRKTTSFTVNVVEASVNPTGITLSPTSLTLYPNQGKALTVIFAPSNANSNLGLTWSSNSSVITVDDGMVFASASATTSDTAIITATSTYDSSITASVNVTIEEEPAPTQDAWTIMIYLCGSDLESGNGLATSDLKEILSVAGQPDDVNIIVQTGGASSWYSTYGISASKLGRYHIENKSLKLDASLTYASMGLTSTFQSFLEWGLTNYPAEKTGVILWNHGGALDGACFDENEDYDGLTNDEVKTALSNVFSKKGLTEKLEWIGYDCCLMQVQDIAEFNSEYFNYMVASEELESGYGWDYDTWVDDLYSKKPTETILKAIVDGFIKDNGGTSSLSNDQTLSYLNLNNMPTYKTAWENLASGLSTVVSSYGKNNFQTLMKSVKCYASETGLDSSQVNEYIYQYGYSQSDFIDEGSYYTLPGYVDYGVFDVIDFLDTLGKNSSFSSLNTEIAAVRTAFANLVAYSSCGKAAGNYNGLTFFFRLGSRNPTKTTYKNTFTSFTNWASFVSAYGL